MSDLRNAKIIAAEKLMSQLNEVNDMLMGYIYETKADGTDSQAADDYLNVIQMAETVIQSFVNRISDISEAEQDDAETFEQWHLERIEMVKDDCTLAEELDRLEKSLSAQVPEL